MSKESIDRTLTNLYKYGVRDGLMDKPARNWKVEGEDPNCNMGGNHHNPLVGHFYGTYEEIVALSVNLPKFFSWGGGGKITPYDHPEIISVRDADPKILAETIKQNQTRRAALAKLSDEERKVLGLA